MLVKAKCKQCGRKLRVGEFVTPVCMPAPAEKPENPYEDTVGKIWVAYEISGAICAECVEKVMAAAMKAR